MHFTVVWATVLQYLSLYPSHCMQFLKTTSCSLFVLLLALSSAAQAEPFTKRVVTTGLNFPWELIAGPDGWLWVTERVGGRITRVDPATGTKTTAVTISEVYTAAGQDGLMGMVLHPSLGTGAGQDWVYVAYTYDADPSTTSVSRKTKIVRFTYNTITKTLESPVTVLSNLPASNDHNSGRLVMGADEKLYYTIGDLGANQFGNKCNEIQSQVLPTATQVTAADWAAYAGKILRLNLDGSVPTDNPVLGGVRSHVYSYGHRNAQGLVFGAGGILYSAEHGPKSDDEINVIIAGKNYGWPFVSGFKDGQAYEYGNWSGASNCASLAYSDYTLPAGVPRQTEASFTAADFQPPIRTLFTVNNSYNFQNAACAGNYFICWPTVGPSSLDVYTKTAGGIPGWANSLLVVSLKQGKVYRLKLAADGLSTADTIGYFETTNRYRDVAVSADGTKFYLATDNSGSTSGPTAGYTSTLENPGSILEFSYTGTLLNLTTRLQAGLQPRNLEIKLYPNPVVSTLHYQLPSGPLPLYLQVYNADGQEIVKMILAKRQGQLGVGHWPKGSYLLTIKDANGTVLAQQKLIK